MKCVKYVLFLFNLIFFLAGLTLIIAGALVQTKLSSYFDFFGGSVTALAVLLIVVGSIIFLIGFFGCCGAYKENYCMTMTFAFLLGIIFILEIAAGIAAYVMRDQVGDLIEEKMIASMSEYGQAGEESITTTWNVMQEDMKCCGSRNYTEWEDTNYGQIPQYCCVEDETDPECVDDTSNIYVDGCLNSLITYVEDNIITIGGIGIGLAFIQIIGIIIACCLAQSIRKEYEVV